MNGKLTQNQLKISIENCKHFKVQLKINARVDN